MPECGYSQREREATAALIAHLAVLDERRLYLAEGCSCLFTYCTQVLHLSESATYRRIEVARTARMYPVVLTMLSDGSVNLTTILLLAPELTPTNHREALDAARYKSKRQAEELVASLRPKPPVPSSIRKLPGAGKEAALDMTLETLSLARAASASPPIVSSTARVVALAPERYKVTFTASAETYAKLRQAQDLLRHQIADGVLEKIVNRALTLLLKEASRSKFAATERPVERRATNGHSRHVPANVKRKVWVRDGGRCAFVSNTGLYCTERAFLEFHHVVPYSAGGQATVDNMELRCRSHNGYEAELYFGSVQSEPEFRTVEKLGL